MRMNRVLFRAGLLLYVISFFLVSLGPANHFGGDKPLYGFASAYLSLIGPLVEKDQLLQRGVVFYSCLLISGWINVAFLLALVFKQFEFCRNAAAVLRGAIIAAIPVTWVVIFHYFQGYPREGYVFWVAGMLLVVMSDKVSLRPPHHIGATSAPGR